MKSNLNNSVSSDELTKSNLSNSVSPDELDESTCDTNVNTITISPATTNLSYINTGGPILTVNNSSNWWTSVENLCIKSEIELLITYLSEKEIVEILSKVKSRMKDSDKNSYKTLLGRIVSRRHFSEQFLLDNFEDLDKSDILAKHEADIYSGEYTQLGLLISVGVDK